MTDPRFKWTGRIETEKLPRRKNSALKGFPFVSVSVLSVLIAACLLANFIAGKDPTELNLQAFSTAPCSEFPLGTDNLGRDILSCILYGGRISLFIGLLGAGISAFIGIVYGTASGIAPEWLDSALMRFAEIVFSIPSILLIVFIQAIFGSPNVLSISISIGVTGWFSIAKVVRTEVRQIRNNEYVIASRCMGAGFFHILRVHLLPNFIPSIMFMVVMNISSAIAAEAVLSFMGLGLPIEVISIGSMLSLAQNALMSGQWWIILFPGLFLAAVIICTTEIGNRLRKRANRKDSVL